jgi:hypothetical protein
LTCKGKTHIIIPECSGTIESPGPNKYVNHEQTEMGKIRGSHFPNFTGCRAGKAKK